MAAVTENSQGLWLRAALALIRGYQKTLSPDHGWLKPLFPYGACRFEPTCSQYAIEALVKFGWAGMWPTLKRISRCHPWHAGGYDPVEKL